MFCLFNLIICIVNCVVYLIPNQIIVLLCGVYRPSSMKDDKFIEDFTNTFDKASLNYENILVLDDLNYNMQDGEKSSPLQSVCDIFDYSNLVKKRDLLH